MSSINGTMSRRVKYLNGDQNLVIVMGPNMAGKTVYLKQVLLLQIMAQIGSCVPAESATFRITNKIFSRLGSDDDLESNCSTFAKEVRLIAGGHVIPLVG